ncbi:hypothetical protein [Kitasatospora cineracea]|uniref:hypothetical protein n=1 Tax=Kitasatospora cineracea TaxID=88074 RepID=UPI0038086F03
MPLGVPEAVDRYEASSYRHSVAFRGERPAGAGAADALARAAGLLAAAGWEVAGPEEEAGGAVRRYVLTARHPDGNRIELRSDDGSPGVRYGGRTPAVVLREPAESRRPEPVRTPGTVTPGFVLCYECDGLGACDQCGGRGWFPDRPPGRRRCPACSGRRVCPICRGGGQLAVSDLSAYQQGYYPEL